MALRDFYQRQMFFPGAAGLFLNPCYLARKGLADQMKHLNRFIGGKTLDIGCGARPYEKCFEVSRYVGLEINSAAADALSHADVRYDGYQMPFRDNSFDSVVAFQVLEHVFEPEVFLHEIGRVLKPEGVLLLTVPFLWEEHEKPNDFARYSSFGLAYLLNKQGFEVIHAKKTMPGFRAALQIANISFYNRFSQKNRTWWNLLISVCITGPVNVLAMLFGKAISTHPDLYLDNVVLARPREGIRTISHNEKQAT